jgi:tetratricopeptide (TPR) repeat protein
MNKIIKRILLTIVTLVGIYLLVTLGTASYIVYQEHKTAEAGRKNIEGARISEERRSKIYNWGQILKNGDIYEKEGKYDLAIDQYRKALELGANKSVCKAALARVYEKSNQYGLAIQEIDWIIAQNPREEVKDEYIARKQKLEKLITERSM